LDGDEMSGQVDELTRQGGWVKIHRKLLSHPVWRGTDAMARLAITLIVMANRLPGKTWDGCGQLDIPAGSFFTSLGKLSEAANVTKDQTRTSLKNFKKLDFSTHQRTGQGLLVTVHNYERYQIKQDERPTPSPTRSPRGPHAVPTKQERKKFKKDTFTTTTAARKGTSDGSQEEIPWAEHLVAGRVADFLEPGPPSEELDSLAAELDKLIERWPKHRRTRRHDAEQKWAEQILAGEITSKNLAAVFEGLERWLKSKSWNEDEGKWVPSLAKWLEDRKWKDHPQPEREVRISNGQDAHGRYVRHRPVGEGEQGENS
jgi:hypothetical protein